MDYLYILIPSVFLLLIFITLLLLHFKKKSVIQKVNSLNTAQKQATLDTLSEPVGYCYDACQDLFIARRDAPQKIFGYTTFYDLAAPYFNMIFDYETIYFNYDGRTWLLEMWKGQYGINTGCELGLYYADTIIQPKDYSSTLFHSVEAKDMLDISLELNRTPRKENVFTTVGKVSKHHWWLTQFKMGMFSKPQNLLVNTAVRFKDCYMLYSFLNSFENTLPHVTYTVNNLTVYFTFYQSRRSYPFFKKLVRHFALTCCHLYCSCFNYVTRPFQNSGDKLLYLYYYLPFMARLILKQKTKKSTTHKHSNIYKN